MPPRRYFFPSTFLFLFALALWHGSIVQKAESRRPSTLSPFPFFRRLLRPKNQSKAAKDDMGNAVRMMKYDRAANVANAVPALSFHDAPLKWHRLDDGVMGGRSETTHVSTLNGVPGIHFAGFINTDGGGFTSIRTPLETGLPKGITALRLKFRGDGKTYKVLLSDGTPSGPMARTPSWQADLPTKKISPDDEAEVATLKLSSFVPSFGGSSASSPSRDQYQFDAAEIKEMGLMLSLRLSDGRPNPPETFGEGIFDFSLFLESIEPVTEEKGEPSGEAKDL